MGNQYPRSAVSPHQISTQSVDIDHMVIKGTTVENITNDENVRDPNILPSSAALHKGMETVKELIQQLDPNNKAYADNTVISLPLLPEAPGSDEWHLLNFSINPQHSVIYTGGTGTNSIRAPRSTFSELGHYFIVTHITRMDSGRVDLYDHTGQVVKSYDHIGTFYYEYKVDDGIKPIAQVELKCADVRKNDIVVIDKTGVYKANQRIRDYVAFALAQHSGGTSFATEEYVEQAIKQALSGITDITALQKAFSDHLLASNPHNITAPMIGAATANHKHTEYVSKSTHQTSLAQLTAELKRYSDNNDESLKNEVKTYTDGEVAKAHDDVENQLNEHISTMATEIDNKLQDLSENITTAYTAYTNNAVDSVSHRLDMHESADNPHNITPESISAARVGHTHDASEITGITQLVLNGIKNVSKLCVIDSSSIDVPYIRGKQNITHAPVLVHGKYLQHTTDASYDYYSGYAYGTVKPESGMFGNIWKMPNVDGTVDYATFLKSETDNRHICFGYSWGYVRHVKSITVSSSPLYGVPTSFTLFDDTGQQVFHSDTVFSPDETSHTFDVVDQRDPDNPAELYLSKCTFCIGDVDYNDTNKWTLHVDVEFALESKRDYEIPTDTAVTYAIEGNTHVATVKGGGVGIIDDLSQYEDGMTLYVIGRVNREDELYSAYLSPIRPEISQYIGGINILGDVYDQLHGTSHPWYGTFTSNGVNADQIYKLFKEYDGSFTHVNDNARDLVLEYTSNNAMPLHSVTLIFDRSMKGELSINIDGVDKDNQPIQLASMDHFVPQILSETELSAVCNLQIETNAFIKSMTISITSTADVIPLQHIDVRHSNDTYHISSNTSRYADKHDNDGHAYLGHVVISQRGDKHYGLFYPIASSNDMYIPVNALRVVEQLHTDVVRNPFMSMDISIDYESLDDGEDIGLMPTLDIVEVTPDYIVVRADSKDSFVLHVVREWS